MLIRRNQVFVVFRCNRCLDISSLEDSVRIPSRPQARLGPRRLGGFSHHGSSRWRRRSDAQLDHWFWFRRHFLIALIGLHQRKLIGSGRFHLALDDFLSEFLHPVRSSIFLDVSRRSLFPDFSIGPNLGFEGAISRRLSWPARRSRLFWTSLCIRLWRMRIHRS